MHVHFCAACLLARSIEYNVSYVYHALVSSYGLLCKWGVWGVPWYA